MAKRKDSTLDLAAIAVKLIDDAKAEGVKIIANATEKAAELIAVSAKSAKGVIAEDAATAARALNIKNADGGSDHDFLLTFSSEVKTKLNSIADDIKELKSGTERRISALEIEKLSIKDSYPILYKTIVDDFIIDHEKRMRDVERNNTRIIAIGSILVVITEVIVALIVKFVH